MKKSIFLILLVTMASLMGTAQYDEDRSGEDLGGYIGDEAVYDRCGYGCDEDIRTIGVPSNFQSELLGESTDLLSMIERYGEGEMDFITNPPIPSLDEFVWGDSDIDGTSTGDVIASDDGTTEDIIKAGGIDYLTLKEKCDGCDSDLAYFNLDNGSRGLASEPTCEMIDEDNNCVSPPEEDVGGGAK